MRQGMCTGLRDAYIRDRRPRLRRARRTRTRPDLFKVFGGYPYNPLSMTRVLGARMPGATPEMIDQAFFDERDEVPPYEHQAWHDSVASTRRSSASPSAGRCRPTSLDVPRRRQASWRAGCARADPTSPTLSDSALHARARSMLAVRPADVRERHGRLLAIGTRHRRARCDRRGARRSDDGDPAARRDRSRLGGSRRTPCGSWAGIAKPRPTR